MMTKPLCASAVFVLLQWSVSAYAAPASAPTATTQPPPLLCATGRVPKPAMGGTTSRRSGAVGHQGTVV